MCGIAGMVASSPDERALHAMPAVARALQHRGPDDGGFFLYEPGHPVFAGRDWPQQIGTPRVAFVHRRLSILDLHESGWQPMQYGDGRYAIAFNGEVYNYVELRGELERLGHRFRSSGDTEVVLAAYAQWGTRAFERFTGMFAFALLDTQRNTIVLCRDPFGIKPLYYACDGNALYFASELPALLEFVPTRRTADAAQLYRYLRFGITDEGTTTLLSGIQQIRVACYAEISLERPAIIEQITYWQPRIESNTAIGFEEAAAEMRRLFLQSIRLHLRSDVPVGSALSGGIDSSAVVCAMREVEPSIELHAFSYIASGSPLNEERYVDLVAQRAGAIVHKVYPQADDLVGDLALLSTAQGEPFRSTSIFAQYRVFREAARNHIKVILDGQGADELLGGYRGFLGVRLAELVRSGKLSEAASFLRNCTRNLGASPAYLVQKAAEFLLPAQVQGSLRKIVGRELLPSWMNERWFSRAGVRAAPAVHANGGPLLKNQLLHELQSTSLPSLLRYEDRNSMAFSVESRVPFLTKELAEFVLQLPESYIIGNDGTTKRVFREAMRGLVPDAILDRRDKIGFATPEEEWMRRLDRWIRTLLASDAAESVAALDLGKTRQLWDDMQAGRRRFDFELWRALNVIQWTGQFNVSYA
jgi:asparagine synthase (glutamine-hydrolysing)